MDFNNLKIGYTDEVDKEAKKNLFKGKFRLLSLFWAQVKCHCYLLWAGLVRGECLIVCYDDLGKRNLIGTVTGEVQSTSYVDADSLFIPFGYKYLTKTGNPQYGNFIYVR